MDSRSLPTITVAQRAQYNDKRDAWLVTDEQGRQHDDAGTRRRGDAGTRGRGAAGTRGRGDAGTRGRGDAGTRKYRRRKHTMHPILPRTAGEELAKQNRL